MRVTLITDHARELAPTGQLVQPGETIEVPTALGESLCEQVDVWKDATPRSKPTRSADK